jgi:hypothetical protein
MKKMKKAVFFVVFLVTGFTVFGWSITPHAVIAYLGYKHATPEAKSKIIPLLKSTPTLPGKVKCYVTKGVKNPDSFWPCAVSSWPDSIKFCPTDQWGVGGENAQNFYANAHFMDTPFNYGTTEKLSPQEAMGVVLKQIKDVDGTSKDDLFYVYTSCIKSLALSQTQKTAQKISKDEQIFALRFLIHLSGDCTQPLHMSDPMYELKDKMQDSFGGNTINFTEDIIIQNDGYKGSLGELHELWDNPGSNFAPFLPYQITDTEIYINKKSAEYLKNISNEIDKNFSPFRNKITKNIGYSNKNLVLSWVIDTYISAVENVCKGLGPIISYNEKMSLVNKHGNKKCISLSPNTSLKVGSSVIETPSDKYIKDIQPIVRMQMYKGAIRLSNLLNAIYDPEHAPENYTDYINALISDKSVPTVNQLCQVFPNQD